MLARFDGVEVDRCPQVLHESTKEDKGKELVLILFKSPFP
jgi:hypothetical protein